MKKFCTFLMIVLFAISCRYDDTDILAQLQDHEARIARLETLVNQINTNVISLQALLVALQNNDYVTSIAPINEGGVEIGYTMTFAKSDPVTIYHGRDGKDGADGKDGMDGKDGIDGVNGKDGADGSTPVIGARQDEDGVYYWTLNGEWLTDDEGNKIPVTGNDGADGVDGNDGQDGSDGKDGVDGINGTDGAPGADGKDGITPQLKIEDGYWYVSYDGGENWTQVGKATGDAGADGTDGKDGVDGDTIFAEIDSSNADYVVFTLTDGTVIKLPTWKAFEELQTKVNEINANLVALQAIVEALQNNDYVTSITPITENRIEIGYVINFSKSLPVTIYNGKDGIDGADADTPVIGVKKYSDDLYYWTVDEEWLLDDDGNKVKASGVDGEVGSDGRVPQLDIKDGYWWVSYDGMNWTNLGEASGVSNLVNVKVEGSYVYLTLDDEVILTIPLGLVVPEMTVEYGYSRIVFTGKACPISPDYLVGVYVESSEEELMEAMAFGLDGIAGGTHEFAEDGSFIFDAYVSSGVKELHCYTFVKANGVFSFGEISSFIFDSNDADVTCEITEVTENSVTFAGNIKLKYPDDVPVFIQCNGSTLDSPIKQNVSLNDNGDFEHTLTGLSSEQTFQYHIGVDFGLEKFPDVMFFYPTQSTFKTMDPYDIKHDLDVSAATDLSADGTANSYIVSSQGLYKFQAVKGNDKSLTLDDASCASILWETYGTSYNINKCDLIRGTCLNDGYVVFETAEIFKEGNAVIAVKDDEGNILWSWHIWLTDQPESQIYYVYDYDTDSFTSEVAGVMMDRNIGATSAAKGDVGALGLLYQWGRKDPFLGSSSISASNIAMSTVTWPPSVLSTSLTGTIEYVTANPTTFVTNGSSFPYNWHINSEYDKLWHAEKTIYDPCPAGWCIPDGDSDGIWVQAGFNSNHYDSTRERMTLVNNGVELWYPATGVRHVGDGTLDWVGDSGSYWAASSGDAGGAYFMGFGDIIIPSGDSYNYFRARGYSVRCVKE